MGWAKQRYKQAKRQRHERSAIKAVLSFGRRVSPRALKPKK